MASNNPPDVLVALSREDTELLRKDSESAQAQILASMMAFQHDPDVSQSFFEQMAHLLEFKKRVKDAQPTLR